MLGSLRLKLTAQTFMHELYTSAEQVSPDGTTGHEQAVLQAVAEGWRVALEARFGAPEELAR